MSLNALLDAVGDILGVPAADPEDSFIELGGTSIAAIKILARYERDHGIRIDPADFLSCDSLGDLAPLLESSATTSSSQCGDADGQSDVFRVGSVERRVPVTLAQAWALQAESDEPDSPPLQFQVAYRLSGPLDVPVLQAALSDVHEHHMALRTRFERSGPDDSFEMVVHDEPHRLSHRHHPLISSSDEKAVEECVTSFARTPFSATSPERWRSLIVEHGGDRWTLCLSFDHRAVDGWSLGVVLDDLSTAYTQRCFGQDVNLSEAGSYLSYSVMEHREAGSRLARAVAFWQTRLPHSFKDFPVILPGRLEDPALTEPEYIMETIPAPAADALDQARRFRQTPFVVATTALARVVGDQAQLRSVRILTSSANRAAPGTERTVGWFATGIFPTYDLDPDGSWEQDLQTVAKESSAALDVGNLPAVLVRTALWPQSPTGFRKDSGIYLACGDGRQTPLALRGIDACEFPVADRADAPGLQFFIQQRPDRWELTCYFHKGEYPMEPVRAVIDLFYHQLTQLTKGVSG